MSWTDPSAPWNDQDPATPLTAARFKATLASLGKYTDDLAAAIKAFVYKGTIDCSAEPKYPAAVAGEAYVVSVAGKIGGAAGVAVVAGDLLICKENAAEGTQAEVGAKWDVVQVGGAYAVGPATATDGAIAEFDGTTGKLLKDSAVLLSSVVSGSLKELGEVEGNVTPNLSEGHVFTMTAKGNVTIKKPTNWPAGVTYAELRIAEDAEGGRTITLEGVTWLGGELVFTTTSNAINAVRLVSWDGGTHWYAYGVQKGETGATGPEAIGSGGLLRPSEVITYVEVGASSTEALQAISESMVRPLANTNMTLATGVPVVAPIEAPANKTISGLGFQVITTEGTAANRTHLWVAILNSKLELLRLSADFTSSTFTSLLGGSVKPHGLKFTSTYKTGGAPELLYGVLCEVMSSTACITIAQKEGVAVTMEAQPPLAMSGETGRTTPASLASPIVPSAYVSKMPYLILV